MNWSRLFPMPASPPDSSQTYNLSDLESAAAAIHNGKTPQFSCSSNEVSQVYYYFNIQGNAINGAYVPVDSREYRSLVSVQDIYVGTN
jgi:hypothetical protein